MYFDIFFGSIVCRREFCLLRVLVVKLRKIRSFHSLSHFALKKFVKAEVKSSTGWGCYPLSHNPCKLQ